jgi:hypothetical protein
MQVPELFTIAREAGVRVRLMDGRIVFGPRAAFEALPAHVQDGLRAAKAIFALHVDETGEVTGYRQWGPCDDTAHPEGLGRCAVCWRIVHNDGVCRIGDNGEFTIVHEACIGT